MILYRTSIVDPMDPAGQFIPGIWPASGEVLLVPTANSLKCDLWVTKQNGSCNKTTNYAILG